ncbi:MAG: hypothetical protein JWR80_7369 [Bradyrhizobium sp.]|nr:hypothetical protein [Bradyrhizobium sp.]
MTFDVIIVGTGPAGVSAAFPLLDAGLKVLMVDAGGDDAPKPPAGEYLSMRKNDRAQWDWLVGSNHDAIRFSDATSPKLRVPNLAPTFTGFNELNGITAQGFTSIGSLASGGLSNAWGSGVARFDADELADFPILPGDLDVGYAAVARRIGISGRSDDDLRNYFGVDDFADEPLAIDSNCGRLLERYRRQRLRGTDIGVRIGRARLALLTQDRDDRLGCDLSGLCLWGCDRRAIYSARYDLDKLKRHPNLTHRTGVVVDRLIRNEAGWTFRASDRAGASVPEVIARTVILAAGTIATSSIALRSQNRVNQPLRLLSNPTAAFVLVLPEQLGQTVGPGQSMGQLVTSIDGVSEFGNIYCGMFPAAYIPAREFVARFPLSRATALDLWRMLMPATVVANCFLPGAHSDHTLTLRPDGKIAIRGGHGPTLAPTIQALKRRLAKAFRKLGAFIPPGGFITGSPGSDIHYAGTLPMGHDGCSGMTRPNGEMVDLPGVYVADAACLPNLPAKPHTLTMMANAHRLASGLAQRLS